jgi:hypothetical protein
VSTDGESAALGCAACGAGLDRARYARCDVCRGATYCIACANAHLCTSRCTSNGCVAGLCVHLVRDGVTDPRYGIHE